MPVNFEIQDEFLLWFVKILRIKSRKILSFIAGSEFFINRLGSHHVFLIAAGIAFNIILYLIPLLLVAVYIVDITFGSEQVIRLLSKSMNDILPPGQQSDVFLKSAIGEVELILNKSAFFGWIGIISLLWLSSALFSSLRSGLNRIFEIETPHFFLVYKLRDIFITIVLAILIMISSYAFPVFETLERVLRGNSPGNFEPLVSSIYVNITTIITSFIMFYLLFRFVPSKRTRRYSVLLSTIICVVLVEISRRIFSIYISGATAYGNFYGAYTMLASIAIWIYYLSLIMLSSAELGRFILEIRDSSPD